MSEAHSVRCLNTASRYGWPIVIAAAALAVLPAFWVSPAIDDLMTTRPIETFSIEILAPGLFWRPLENLLRLAAGRYPALHPFGFHLFAALGHLGSVLVLFALLRRCCGQLPALLCTVIFAVSPANGAAIWSVDSAIQTLSTLFGLLAVLALVALPRRTRTAAALTAMALSVLWKESGVAWFLAAPLFAAVLSPAPPGARTLGLEHRAWRGLAVGLIGAGLYVALRVALSKSGGLGVVSGRYAVQLNPVVWARNGAMLAGVASTTLDTLALFGKSAPWAAALSLLCGVPLLALVGRRVLGAADLPRLLWGAIAVVIVMGPHLLLGHVSEMYAHPVTAAGALVVMANLGTAPRFPRRFGAAYGAFLVAAVAVSAHKYVEMRHTGDRAEAVADAIVRDYGGLDGLPERVCTIQDAPSLRDGYSVFYAAPPKASNWGRSVWTRTDWRRPAKIVNAADPAHCPNDGETIWRIDAAGALRAEGAR